MSSNPIFLPKILTTLGGYTRRQFLSDVIAGVTVGLVALPLAIAFGIASVPDNVAKEAGVSPPAMGLFTAVIAGFLISALGGTRVAIGGPTGAFVVIIYAIAMQHGYAGLCVATVLAGVILVGLGLLRMGGMIKYIPYPVTTGFTSGIAVIIFMGQVKDLLGLRMGSPPPGFVSKMKAYAVNMHTIEPATAAVGLSCAALVFLWPRLVTKKIPGAIVALVLATMADRVLGLGLETIGSRFGHIPTSIPMPNLAPLLTFDKARIEELIGPAFTIAMLGGIESLLCAVVADGMLGTRHRSNTELIAQGIANIATPIFGGIPATGAIARTATNVQAGGRTPIAGIVHALTLLVIILAIGRFAEYVPMAALAAVLVVVAYNMSEAHRFIWLLRGPRPDAVVLVATFALTVLTDLTVAVSVGLVMAAMLFIKRMADVTNVSSIQREMVDPGAEHRPLASPARGMPGVEVYEINGPFFFGAAYKLRETLDSIGRRPRVLVLDMPNVSAIDATGLYVLDELRRKCEKEGVRVILAGVHAQPLFAMTQAGLLDKFGVANLAGTLDEALARLAAVPDGSAPRAADSAPAQ